MAQVRNQTGKFRKRTAPLVVLWICSIFLLSCAEKSRELYREETHKKEHITMMHTDAGKKEFDDFIRKAEEILDMEITVLPYPINADSRQAKVSSLLAAGDKSVDIFSINDEMISEFKYAGYLEPLQKDVMDPQTAAVFPQEYLKQILMEGDQIYSAPYMMDVLVLWVNERWLKEAGLQSVDEADDFKKFLSFDWGRGRYAYGGSWEKTYAHNEIGEFINLFGGDFYDWQDPKTQNAVRFLKEMVEKGYTSEEILVDQYEQMNQKFIDGKYGMVFMYSATMNTYVDADAYGQDRIHLTGLPDLGSNTTFIATWQYAINRASENKEAAKRFIRYAVSREGSRLYAEKMNRLPAREDLIWEEKLQVTGFDEMREYLKKVKLLPRPMRKNAMAFIAGQGELFQKYVTGELEEEEYFRQMQRLVKTGMS